MGRGHSAGRPLPWRDPDNAPVIAMKRRIANLLTSPAVGATVRAATKGLVRSHGLRIDTRSPEIADATRAALLFRTYESAELRLVRHLKLTRDVVDLGASLGVVSSAAARRMPAGGQITCVEANSGVLALAESNVRANAPHVSVRPVHGAVEYGVDEGDPVSFDRGRLHVGSSKSDQPASNGFSAPALRLRSIAPQGPYTLIMDIEGAEAAVFHEDSATLERCLQMLVELHETTYRGSVMGPRELLNIAADLGFREIASYGNSFILSRV